MKPFPQNCCKFLPELTEELKIAPPETASDIIYRAAYLFIFAGYGDAAYEALSYLRSGTLQMNPSSALNSYQYLILTLCNALAISSPDLPEHSAMSVDKLSQFIGDRAARCRAMLLMDKYSLAGLNIPPELEAMIPVEMRQLVAPVAPNWTEEDLQIMLGNTDRQLTLPEIGDFLKEVGRISQFYCRDGQLDRAIELMELYDRICKVWKLSMLDYVSKSTIVMSIDTCFRAGYKDRAEAGIIKWWQQIRDFSAMDELLVYPQVMSSLLAGILREEISISSERVNDFIQAIKTYSYTPQPLIVPSTLDWKELMEKWSDDIFTKSSTEELEGYKDWYPQAYEQRDCSKSPATNIEIEALERRLGKTLPPSYRNFLLYSNGWLVMNSFSELYGTKEIDWLRVQQNDLITCWDDDYPISDEQYFYYGAYQSPSNIRNRYLKTALQISNYEDGYVYLLNPEIIDERGEWEAWDFGTKISGAYRYRSFWDMMQRFYQEAWE
jgi:hypothetical protein